MLLWELRGERCGSRFAVIFDDIWLDIKDIKVNKGCVLLNSWWALCTYVLFFWFDAHFPTSLASSSRDSLLISPSFSPDSVHHDLIHWGFGTFCPWTCSGRPPGAGVGIRLTGNLPNQGKNHHVQPVLSISVKMIQDLCYTAVLCLITGGMNSAFVYGSQGWSASGDPPDLTGNTSTSYI